MQNIMERKEKSIRKRKNGYRGTTNQKVQKNIRSKQKQNLCSGKPSDIKSRHGDPALTPASSRQAEAREASASKRILFTLFVEQWKEMVRYKIKVSSFSLYNTLLERHLTPYFGKMYLDEIDNICVQKFIVQKITEQYATSYIRSMVVLLKNILQKAQEQQKIYMPYIDKPTLSRTKPGAKNFSTKDWNTLRNFLINKSDAFSFGILLCMSTGIRIGELSGLKWSDFDMETGQFIIQRTVSRIRNLNAQDTEDSPKTILNIGSPKTPSSIRRIPLPSFLTEHIPRQPQNPDCFILTGTRNCMEPRTIQKKYSKCLKECHIPYLNFHALRHSFATMGIHKGVDYKSLSEILGHSSVTITLNTYVHSDINRKRQCMELLWS